MISSILPSGEPAKARSAETSIFRINYAAPSLKNRTRSGNPAERITEGRKQKRLPSFERRLFDFVRADHLLMRLNVHEASAARGSFTFVGRP